MAPAPETFYRDRLRHHAEAAAREERRADRLADARLALFVIGLLLAWAAWQEHSPWSLIGIPVLGFAALVIVHAAILARRDTAKLGVKLYADLLGRGGFEGTPPSSPFEPSLSVPKPHLYSSDLDLFGRGGLFELLCRTRTHMGAQTLADWLLSPASPEQARARQEAVCDLMPRHELREELALAAGAVHTQLSADDLRRWAEEPARLGAGWRLPTAGFLALAAVAAIPLALLGYTGAPVLVLAANILFVSACRRGLTALDSSLSPIGRELRILATVLALLERAPLEAPLLRQEQARLTRDGQSASQAIRRLDQLAAGFETWHNQLFIVIALYTLWPFWWGWAIERWRARHRDDLHHAWVDALGRLEALSSIAGYAFERPDDTWPEWVEQPTFEAEDLGHPLLAVEHRVRNAVSLGTDTRLYMVSGSNMSGKSTLLRAVGLAAVLAQAGAPVCARRLRLSPVQAGAVIRVEDSIQRGASRFYAEIERFKALLELPDSGPALLFLCDEILHGTNTRDRVAGARALIRALLERGGIGFVTTHDLALTDFVGELTAAINVHFQDDMRDGRLAFDYRLREGVVTKSNALDLMRAIGLPVDG